MTHKERGLRNESEIRAARAFIPDFCVFGAGLIGAWLTGWQTTSLVWSLWLSSLVIGYASIVLALWRAGQSVHRGGVEGAVREGMGTKTVGSRVVIWGFTLFLLGFFTVHFGGFHFGHSVFLSIFFPVDGGPMRGDFPKAATYWTVLKENAWFLPLALIAQREMFRRDPELSNVKTWKESQQNLGDGMVAPYKNVVRLHLLIFFFVFAMILKLPAALIYLVVYSVYFFPWRILKRNTA